MSWRISRKFLRIVLLSVNKFAAVGTLSTLFSSSDVRYRTHDNLDNKP
jgi:hypothetical protein